MNENDPKKLADTPESAISGILNTLSEEDIQKFTPEQIELLEQSTKYIEEDMKRAQKLIDEYDQFAVCYEPRLD